MNGALMKASSRFAIAAALGLVVGVGSVRAADLGGNCCADLEERIAELEATTVRKGNRKVSLEISGQVNEAVLWWDDGAESNAYVVTHGWNPSGWSATTTRQSAHVSSDEAEAVSRRRTMNQHNGANTRQNTAVPYATDATEGMAWKRMPKATMA